MTVRESDWSVVWAASGAAGLSGRADGPPLDVPIGLVRAATEAASTIAARAAAFGVPVEVDGPALLGERAALGGLGRRGTISCGGGTRLVQAADGWLALSLVRESDIDSVPAWLEVDDPALAREGDELWEALTRIIADRSARELVDRAVLLGMPIGRLGETAEHGGPAQWVQRTGSAAPARSSAGLVVVDLSSLWAGPLCAQLLGSAGMRVIKVESEQRPDGARDGSASFFDVLHGGHESVCLDFRAEADRRALAALLQRADVVIEGSRPRALAQLGIVAPLDGPRVWVSITGHGRSGAAAERIGFGDDAAVAGGLVTGTAEAPCFCVDAVADPLTGMSAAAIVLDRLAVGDRWLIDMALARTAAWATTGPLTNIDPRQVAAPRARPVRGPAPRLGEHTDSVLAELGIAR